MKKPSRGSRGGDREKAFFTALTGKTVMFRDLAGSQSSGKLLWVGPYSLIIERHGIEELYWKHSLSSIRLGNGRAD